MLAVAISNGPLGYTPPKRQEIGGFSAASRLRLFKITNRIDFERAGRVTFMTTTWRDEVGRPSAKEITLARSDWQRSIERLCGGHVSGIWRTEWKKRLSGRYAGQPMPHIHTIYFRMPYLQKEAVTAAWARSIGWEGRVSVRLEEVVNLKACLSYVSKYLAKVPDLGNLDIESYLSSGTLGRQWGVYRKNELPLCDKWEFRIAPGPLLDKIRRLATEHYPKVTQDPGKGFVVFGNIAEKIAALCERDLTDSEQKIPS